MKTFVVFLLHRLSSAAHGTSSVELDDMLQRKRRSAVNGVKLVLTTLSERTIWPEGLKHIYSRRKSILA